MGVKIHIQRYRRSASKYSCPGNSITHYHHFASLPKKGHKRASKLVLRQGGSGRLRRLSSGAFARCFIGTAAPFGRGSAVSPFMPWLVRAALLVTFGREHRFEAPYPIRQISRKLAWRRRAPAS